MSKTVFVGLSGGVDSSVSAALLKEQGFRVVGVHMKNWSRDVPGYPCPWRSDYQDAKRVAVQLGIDFELFDFEQAYEERVVGYMLEQYQLGLTPNPDIMCNQEIKFKLFYDAARERGADFIATGHYAKAANGKLYMAKDDNKDQTYFLYRVNSEALQHTLFPLADLTKPEVRLLAAKYNLVTATKKESMGICFVGKIGIKEFLSQYVHTEPGPIIAESGRVVGEHDGALFYTIGQRHGLNVGGGLPYYVAGKDMAKNEVYVTTDIADERLWADSFELSACHWITEPPQSGDSLLVRTRHRGSLVPVSSIELSDGGRAKLMVAESVKALAPGQSAVLYRGDECLGGGIISSSLT
jgi:tRNA-specific 2-thiouridylase